MLFGKSYLIVFSFVLSLIFFSCNNNNLYKIEKPKGIYKEYILDEFGGVQSTEFVSDDFESSENCQQCHPHQYKGWSQSMHAFSMQDPIFFSKWNSAQNRYPDTGERFCVQCHNPIAFITGIDLTEYETKEALETSNLSLAIKEGIGCDICHSTTSLSKTVHTGDNLAAVAEYYLNPGENIKYGSIKNPDYTAYHKSEYNPIFKRSEFCLPCHDITIRGIEAEITFSEWNRNPFLAMSGALSCQDCHMPKQTDEDSIVYHDHRFVGVDIDLSYSIGESPLHEAVHDMLQSAVNLQFGYLNQTLPDFISYGDSLLIPVSIESRTGHSLPSGTSFSREAWLEVKIFDNIGNILYKSGVVENMENLDKSNDELLLFTTTLLDENNNEVTSITQTHHMINNSLPAFESKFHNYHFYNTELQSEFIVIKIRMLFRSFKPYHIQESHPDLLENLPIFEMASISDTVFIRPN